MTAEQPPVTEWIVRATAGEGEALTRLWEHLYPWLLDEAHRRLPSKLRPALDSDHLAASALKKWARGIAAKNLPPFEDRYDLLRLLIRNIERKIIDEDRRRRRIKRGGGREAGEASLGESGAVLALCPGSEPLPEFNAMLADQLEKLGADNQQGVNLRALAVLWMSGHNRGEIAAALGCSAASVDRKLRCIRDRWLEELT
jgi:DNA-directed RNA polymerase specialized sigma24 family protein